MTVPALRPFAIDDDDDGLGALLATGSGPTPVGGLTRAQALRDTTVRNGIRDALLAQTDPHDHAIIMQPFAPAATRNARIVQLLQHEIAQQRLPGKTGPLTRVPTDPETLIGLFHESMGWGAAARYLDDPRVTEVKINNTTILVQESGAPFVEAPEPMQSVEQVLRLVELLASRTNTPWDETTPIATIPCGDGVRLHATRPPRTPQGCLVTIRRGRTEAWTLADLVARGGLSGDVADLITALADAGASILIGGSTNAGKTAMLEAIANSIRLRHTITIEDNVAEISLDASRHARWTRIHVATSTGTRGSDGVLRTNRAVFGQVASEALRMSPGLVILGETRGSEAGAAIALATSDHPVYTSLHASTPAGIVRTLARYAAQAESYQYANNELGALIDICDAFHVAVQMRYLEDLGLRVVSDVALIDAAQLINGRLSPTVVPLVTMTDDDGVLTWQCHAHMHDGVLVWDDAATETPTDLARRLRNNRMARRIQQRGTSLDSVQELVSRAERLLLVSDVARATELLRSAWGQRHDERLLSVMVDALARQSDRYHEERARAADLGSQLAHAISERRWIDGQEVFRLIISDIVLASAILPPGGWAPMEQAIRTGISAVQRAEEVRQAAVVAIQQDAARDALDMLATAAFEMLPVPTALTLTILREQALQRQVAIGQSNPDVLASVQAQRLSLETQLRNQQAKGRS